MNQPRSAARRMSTISLSVASSASVFLSVVLSVESFEAVEDVFVAGEASLTISLSWNRSDNLSVLPQPEKII